MLFKIFVSYLSFKTKFLNVRQLKVKFFRACNSLMMTNLGSYLNSLKRALVLDRRGRLEMAIFFFIYQCHML